MKLKIYSFKPHLHLNILHCLISRFDLRRSWGGYHCFVGLMLSWCTESLQLNPESVEHQLNCWLVFLYFIAVHSREQCSRLILWDPNLLIPTLHHVPVSVYMYFSLHITDTHIVLILCFFIYNVPRCWYCCP